MTLRPHGPQHARLPCPLLFSGVSSECHRGLFSSEVLCRTFVCSVTQSCPALCDSARQAPLTMGAPRQEHWSGWPFPSPGDLFNPGIKLSLLHRQADSLTTEPPGKSVERVTPICSSHSSSILRGSGRKGSHDRAAADGGGGGIQPLSWTSAAGSVEPRHAAGPSICRLRPCLPLGFKGCHILVAARVISALG